MCTTKEEKKQLLVEFVDYLKSLGEDHFIYPSEIDDFLENTEIEK